MAKTRYRTTVEGECPVSFNMWLEERDQAIGQAQILQSNYEVVVQVSEIVTDGEDIISNKPIYDGSDK